MKRMKPFLGYIPAAIALIPLAATLIWQELFYRGCMHGFQYFLIATIAFLIGGVLNIGFLLYVLTKKREYFLFSSTWKSRCGIGGLVISIATLVFQLGMVLYVIHDTM